MARARADRVPSSRDVIPGIYTLRRAQIGRAQRTFRSLRTRTAQALARIAKRISAQQSRGFRHRAS